MPPAASAEPAPAASYVTSHIHVDGPIPGPHSLLSVVSVAHTADGEALGAFTVNVRELPGAGLHPDALQQWRRRAEDWLTTRRGSRPPAPAMIAFTGWIADLPGEKVFVTDPAQPDYLFLFWYLQRFAGQWPFARVSAQAPRTALAPAGLCPLGGCRAQTPALTGTG
ncbi:hypothetical protein SAMN05443637_108185 [Pseudonocardia thermophila]|jgi:hypothetical protein|uniref:Uncharacterized protein n=1 Tax=Pseudonocardia thermophila TaxID=1848 RepID=A0A1M6TQN7_PSETH|nr:hypothetical protein [Pseudonocardia thermophila]SHK59209.1 hypothetical protein SAMN05443637_108185 [Pseudonocardia thermophila]